MGATAFGARMAAMTSSRQRSYAYSNAGNLTSFEGNAYAYNDAAHKHALTHISGVQKYWYDANGNATKRITDATYDLTYDAENRLTQLQKNGAVSGTYVYDGDGNRVKETTGSVNTVYISAYFEWTGSVATMKSYYYAGGVRVAMRTGTSAGTVNYLLGDHLGSQALTLTSAGARLSPNKELRYYPYGVARYDTNNQITSFNFTGQRKDSGSGLLFYDARWYDPQVGRFLSPDTIVPEPGNPQALNRYSYTLNNPLRYTDPTGHAPQKPGDPDDMAGDCTTEWCWQNRWYRAHGYSWTGSGWSLSGGDPRFYDEDITNDVAREHGITFLGAWDFTKKSGVLSGVVLLANAMGGSQKFVENTGFGLCFIYAGPYQAWMSGKAWYQPPFGLIFFAESAFGPNSDPAIAAVHEVAHRWHWGGAQAGFATAMAGQQAPTWYASTDADEWFAETITVAIFGERYVAPLRQRTEERPFLLGLNQTYLDYLGQYLIVNPSAILH